MPRMTGVSDAAANDDIKIAGKIAELLRCNAADVLADPKSIECQALRQYDIDRDAETVRVTITYAVKLP